LGHTSARSIDLDGDFRLAERPGWGLGLKLSGSYLWQLDRQVIEGAPVLHMAGYASQPRWTALSELVWRVHDWTFSGHARYTGDYRNATSSTDPLGCVVSDGERTRCRTPGFILADLGAVWHGIPNWTFALDVHNVFDHAPVYYGSPGIAYNTLFDDVVGRSWLFTTSFGF
ncbi:MAG: TonB-dependent receptor, partial [Luteibacter sp.]